MPAFYPATSRECRPLLSFLILFIFMRRNLFKSFFIYCSDHMAKCNHYAFLVNLHHFTGCILVYKSYLVAHFNEYFFFKNFRRFLSFFFLFILLSRNFLPFLILFSVSDGSMAFSQQSWQFLFWNHQVIPLHLLVFSLLAWDSRISRTVFSISLFAPATISSAWCFAC